MDIENVLRDGMMKTANLVHRGLHAVSGGRIGSTIRDMPVVKLTTIGRVSGKPRTVMLTAPVHDDDQWVFVASKGGDDRHPDWYRNLVANPEITVESMTDDAAPRAFVARTASDDEKADLWPKIVASNDGYAGYQAKTERDIPVVIAEPAN